MVILVFSNFSARQVGFITSYRYSELKFFFSIQFIHLSQRWSEQDFSGEGPVNHQEAAFLLVRAQPLKWPCIVRVSSSHLPAHVKSMENH